MLKQARIKTRDKSRQANKSGNGQAKSKMLINRLSPGEKAKKSKQHWETNTRKNAMNWQTTRGKHGLRHTMEGGLMRRR